MKRLFILLTALLALSSPSPVLAASVADVESEFGVSDLTLVDGVPLDVQLACGWTWIGRTRVRHASVGLWRDCVGSRSPPARSPDHPVRHRRADEMRARSQSSDSSA
jgi:hypothetical protein